MRTFQEKHAAALAAAVAANSKGDLDAAELHRNRAAEWDRLDRRALELALKRGDGPGKHHR